MNRYNLISFMALLIFVAILPIYAWGEQTRRDRAQANLRRQFMVEAADTYVENCIDCHGASGEGIGAMPALNNPALSKADPDRLYDIIAHSPHGSTMAAWHIGEGGNLNSYQVEGLVALIQYADWQQASELAATRDIVLPAASTLEEEIAVMDIGEEEDPHECRACHEEPEVHADRFGLNCSRCHSLQAWTPALLTRHTFSLEHGDQGEISCQTCHVHTYATHTCYECHDHTPEQMRVSHIEEDIIEFDNCAECHPTGQPGEADRLRSAYSSQERDEPAGQVSAHTDW